MTSRPPTLREKLASALLIIADLRSDGIPFDVARDMTADQILSLFQWHHENRRANGGSNHPTNLTPLWIKSHRERTAIIDKPAIDKGKRLASAHEKHAQTMRAKILGGPKPREVVKFRWPKGREIPSRPFPKKAKTA
jgi:hypothetical protein